MSRTAASAPTVPAGCSTGSIRSPTAIPKSYVQSILPVNGVDTKAKPKNHWKKGAEIIETNKLLETLCEGRKNVMYVDVYSALVDEKGMLDKQYTNDGLHLMGEGYLAWKTVIEKFVR